MADGYFPTLVSKDQNVNSQTNVIYTGVSDGTDLLLVNADGSINVTVNNASLVVTATNLDIRDLSAAQDNVAISDGTDTLAVNADGSINAAVLSVVPGTGATNLGKAEDAAHASGDVGVMALSVRNDANTSLVSADGDYAPLQVDATGLLKVNVVSGGSSGAQYAEDTAAVSGDLGTVALAVRQDTLSASVSADGDYGWLKFDSLGRLWVNVNNTVTVSATDLDIRDLNFATDSVEVRQATAANLNATVVATDLDIRDLTLAQDAVRVSANTTANSAANPIFVSPVKAVSTTEVANYNTAAAVAGGGTSNHDYTVTGTTFLLSSIIFSASGKGKVEVQTGPVASLVSRAVAFVTENASNVQLFFDPPIEVPATSTGTVRLIRTNRQNQAQDLYSTILGNDLP